MLPVLGNVKQVFIYISFLATKNCRRPHDRLIEAMLKHAETTRWHPFRSFLPFLQIMNSFIHSFIHSVNESYHTPWLVLCVCYVLAVYQKRSKREYVLHVFCVWCFPTPLAKKPQFHITIPAQVAMNSLKDWVEVDVEGSSRSSKANHIAPGVMAGLSKYILGFWLKLSTFKVFDRLIKP